MSDEPNTLTPFALPNRRQKMDDEKLMLFLDRFPNAESLGRFLDEHDTLVEEADRRKWLFGFIKNVAMWMTAVAAGIAVVRGFLGDIGAGGGKP